MVIFLDKIRFEEPSREDGFRSRVYLNLIYGSLIIRPRPEPIINDAYTEPFTKEELEELKKANDKKKA